MNIIYTAIAKKERKWKRTLRVEKSSSRGRMDPTKIKRMERTLTKGFSSVIEMRGAQELVVADQRTRRQSTTKKEREMDPSVFQEMTSLKEGVGRGRRLER